MNDEALLSELNEVTQPGIHNISDAQSLDIYAIQVGRTNLLTPDEEITLGKKINQSITNIIFALCETASGIDSLETTLLNYLNTYSKTLTETKTRKLAEDLILTLFDRYRVKAEINELDQNADNLIHNIVFLINGIGLSRHYIIELIDQNRPSFNSDKTSTQGKLEKHRALYFKYRNKLIEKNLRLVFSVAKSIKANGQTLEELIQHGNIGLIKATERFDFNRGYRFSTYAYWCIHSTIKLEIQKSRNLIARPPYLQTQQGTIIQSESEFLTQHHRKPNLQELETLTGIPANTIQRIKQLPNEPTSLSEPINSETDNPLEDLIASTFVSPIDKTLEDRNIKQVIKKLYQSISEREQRILNLRYGIGYHKEYTLEEIGNQLGISFERVRQLQKQALKTMTSQLSSSPL